MSDRSENYDEYLDLLRDLGWRKVDALRHIGLSDNAGARWKDGGVVPGPVMAYLRLAVRYQDLGGQLNDLGAGVLADVDRRSVGRVGK